MSKNKIPKPQRMVLVGFYGDGTTYPVTGDANDPASLRDDEEGESTMTCPFDDPTHPTHLATWRCYAIYACVWLSGRLWMSQRVARFVDQLTYRIDMGVWERDNERD